VRSVTRLLALNWCRPEELGDRMGTAPVSMLRSRAVTEARSDTTGRGDPGKIITMPLMEKNAGGAGESDGGKINSDVDTALRSHAAGMPPALSRSQLDTMLDHIADTLYETVPAASRVTSLGQGGALLAGVTLPGACERSLGNAQPGAAPCVAT
jgi:hypothetical protein